MGYYFRRQRRDLKIGDLVANELTIGDVPQNLNHKQNEILNGGKIILPTEALITLSTYEQSLMIFRVTNPRTKKHTFCGVLTFDARPQNVFIPHWILRQMDSAIGELVLVECLAKPIPKGEFALFQPLSPEFQEITNSKAVLEHCLREYSCISLDDVITISYNHRIFDVKVRETRPVNTISIVECDLQVDFVYDCNECDKNTVLPDHNETNVLENKSDISSGKTSDFSSGKTQSFTGIGRRVDGQPVVTSGAKCKDDSNESKRKGIADVDYKIGTISFKRRKTDLVANTSSGSIDSSNSGPENAKVKLTSKKVVKKRKKAKKA